MGEKRVQKLLSEYSDVKTIAKLDPNNIKEALGFPNLIAQSIIELAKDYVSS
jgi:excinuclease UvrABC nuclease subunit